MNTRNAEVMITLSKKSGLCVVGGWQDVCYVITNMLLCGFRWLLTGQSQRDDMVFWSLDIWLVTCYI